MSNSYLKKINNPIYKSLPDLYPEHGEPDVARGDQHFDWEAGEHSYNMDKLNDPTHQLLTKHLNRAVNNPKWAKKKFGNSKKAMRLIDDIRENDWDQESGKKFRLDRNSLFDHEKVDTLKDAVWKTNFQDTHGSLNNAEDEYALGKYLDFAKRNKKAKRKAEKEKEAAPEPVANTGNMTFTPMPALNELWSRSKQKSQNWIVGPEQWQDNLQNYKDQRQSTSEKAGENFLNNYMSQNQASIYNNSARANARSGKIKAMENLATVATDLIT